MRLMETIKLGKAAVRIAALGGNAAFASMLLRPRPALQYAAASLFLHRLASDRGLPQVIPQEIVRNESKASIAVSLSPESWFHAWDPSYGMDLFWLCLITRLSSFVPTELRFRNRNAPRSQCPPFRSELVPSMPGLYPRPP